MAVRVVNTIFRVLNFLTETIADTVFSPLSKVIGQIRKVIGLINAISGQVSIFCSLVRKVFGLIIEVFWPINVLIGRINKVFGQIIKIYNQNILFISLKSKVFNGLHKIFSPVTKVIGWISFLYGHAVHFGEFNENTAGPPSNYVPHACYRHSAGGASLYIYLQRFWMNLIRRLKPLWISLKLLFNNVKSSKMTRKKVIISFVHFTVNELIGFTWFVLSKMTGNADFTTPDPTLAEVKTLVEDLETKNTAAMDGGRTAHAQMVEAKNKLLDKLRSLGLYVEKVANGNLAIMLSSGFPVSSDRTPGSRKDFWVEYGTNSGEILVGCKAFPRAKSYVWQRFVGDASPADDNQWIWCGVSTRTRMGLTNLDRGRVVWLRYCAVTSGGMQGWSEPISIMVV